jgi:hypothetical protein
MKEMKEMREMKEMKEIAGRGTGHVLLPDEMRR